MPLSVLLAICLLSGLAGQMVQLAPVFYGALAEARGFGPAELGKIAGVGGLGGLLTAVSSPLWLPRAPLRLTALVLVLISLAALLLLVFVARSSGETMLVMALQGLASGALYTLLFGAVSLYARPEKTLGWKLGSESLPGLAMLYIVSNLVAPKAGFIGIVWSVVISTLLLGATAFLLPTARPQQAALVEAPGPAKAPLGLWLAVAATFVQWAGVNAVWTFMERIGVARGLSIATIGLVLTLGWIFASVGGLAAGALGTRWGTIKPFLVGSALSGAALLLFLRPSGLSYGVAANLFLTATLFAVVYAMATITTLGSHPMFAGLGSVAVQAAGAVGAAAGGYIYQARGADGLYAFAGLCFAASVGLYLAAHLGRPQPAPTTTPVPSQGAGS